MLVRIRPVDCAAKIARVVKANSSRWVHEKWDAGFAWQTGYGVFSVSESSVPAVKKYIAESTRFKRNTLRTRWRMTRGTFGISFLRPSGAGGVSLPLPHGLRRGLHSFAASRLSLDASPLTSSGWARSDRAGARWTAPSASLRAGSSTAGRDSANRAPSLWMTNRGQFRIKIKNKSGGQGEHHRKHSFQEEYIAFLKKN